MSVQEKAAKAKFKIEFALFMFGCGRSFEAQKALDEGLAMLAEMAEEK